MNANSLLALSLGLQNPNVDLTKTKPSLKQLGRIIQADAEDWEEIQEQLAVILEDNAALNKEYQTMKARLDEVGDIPSDLLPTQKELEQLFPYTGERSGHPGKPELETREIINSYCPRIVFTSEEPKEVSKTLLQRLADWLKQKTCK